MILSDDSIRESLSSGLIEADPAPTEEQIQPASLDVRFGEELYCCDSGEYESSDSAGIHTLEPWKRYLAHTKETIDLPNDIAAQLAGRSSIGRRGVIIHKTAGWIDPGFAGQITLEVMNMGESPVHIEEGERVAQLVFFVLDSPSSGYDGGYQNQSGATQSYQ